MESFVNPIGSIPVWGFLRFDFPTKIKTPGCLSNIDIAQSSFFADTGGEPMHEEVYGGAAKGSPQREQGFPCIYEQPEGKIEWEDPGKGFFAAHDQIVDQDHPVCVDHTARLSGSFVKYLIQNNHKSIVKIIAVPLTHSGDPIVLDQKTVPLVANAKAANQWYWLDPAKKNELIYTAHCAASMSADPGIYRLIVKWEFWSFENGIKQDRLPMSGFSSDMTFELSEPTVNL